MKSISLLIVLLLLTNILGKNYTIKSGDTEDKVPPKRNDTVRMIALGDSITAILPWVKLLGDKLEGPLPGAIEVGNYGDSGATISDSHTTNGNYMRYDKTTLWPAALHSEADIVALFLGSCDAKR